MDYRYISITPLVLAQDAESMYTGSDRTVRELGTFYFPEVREVIRNAHSTLLMHQTDQSAILNQPF